jgi:hypothetical protein
MDMLDTLTYLVAGITAIALLLSGVLVARIYRKQPE